MADIEIRTTLSGRIGARDVRRLCAWCADADGDGRKAELFAMVDDVDDRVGYNVLWVFTHFGMDDAAWLRPRRDLLIDRLLTASHVGKRRLILTLLDRMDVVADDIRTDYLDYCLAGINSTEPYGVRALCLKQAFAQCRLYPELMPELLSRIELMDYGELSPGLISARRNVLRQIERVRVLNNRS